MDTEAQQEQLENGEETVAPMQSVIDQNVETGKATAEDTLPMVEDTLPTAEYNFPPDEDTLPPAEDTLPPAEDTLPLAEDTLPPAEDTLPPVEDTLPPAEDTLPPAEDTVPTAEDTLPQAELATDTRSAGIEAVPSQVVAAAAAGALSKAGTPTKSVSKESTQSRNIQLAYGASQGSAGSRTAHPGSSHSKNTSQKTHADDISSYGSAVSHTTQQKIHAADNASLRSVASWAISKPKVSSKKVRSADNASQRSADSRTMRKVSKPKILSSDKTRGADNISHNSAGSRTLVEGASVKKIPLHKFSGYDSASLTSVDSRSVASHRSRFNSLASISTLKRFGAYLKSSHKSLRSSKFIDKHWSHEDTSLRSKKASLMDVMLAKPRKQVLETVISTTNFQDDSFTSSEHIDEPSMLQPDANVTDMEEYVPLDKIDYFLQTFPKLPNISEISSTTSIEHQPEPVQTERTTEQTTERATDGKGMVVKTVDSYETQMAKMTYENELLMNEEEETSYDVETTTITSSCVSLDSILFAEDTTSEEDKIVKNVDEIDDAYRSMLTIQMQDEEEDGFRRDISNIMIETFRQEMAKQTKMFIDDLIDRTVRYCETYEVKLPRYLDKHKMMEELITTIDTYTEERFVSDYLNKRIVEYYQRKRSYWPISPHKFDQMNRRRYAIALNELDNVLEKNSRAKQIREQQTINLAAEEYAMRQQCDAGVQELENFITETLCQREDFDRIKNIVADQLKRMRRMREELSKVRLSLILKQHAFAHISKKLEKMEDLGEGLNMREFLSKQAEVQGTAKKIEERKADLKRLYIKINSDVHMMAHLKSKEKMMQKVLQEQMDRLAVRRGQQRELREKIHRGNLEHGRIRQEIEELREQGSLLLYPPLMKDYDETVDAIREKYIQIKNLISTQECLTEKIRTLEEPNAAV